jgi:hypothetical protein
MAKINHLRFRKKQAFRWCCFGAFFPAGGACAGDGAAGGRGYPVNSVDSVESAG